MSVLYLHIQLMFLLSNNRNGAIYQISPRNIFVSREFFNCNKYGQQPRASAISGMFAAVSHDIVFELPYRAKAIKGHELLLYFLARYVDVA